MILASSVSALCATAIGPSTGSEAREDLQGSTVRSGSCFQGFVEKNLEMRQSSSLKPSDELYSEKNKGKVLKWKIYSSSRIHRENILKLMNNSLYDASFKDKSALAFRRNLYGLSRKYQLNVTINCREREIKQEIEQDESQTRHCSTHITRK
jgi:hypothetical protein